MCFKEFDEVAYTEMIKSDTRLLTLIELVNKNKLTVKEAAEEAEMSVEEFEVEMEEANSIPVM